MKTFTPTAGIALRARELWIKGRDFSTALWQPFFRKEDKKSSQTGKTMV
jgi:hypothetical protein